MKVGQGLTFFCRDWIYAGKVVAIHDNFVILDPCWQIYDFGQWSNPKWKTYERIPTPWCVQKSAVESWGVGKALPSVDDIAPDAGKAVTIGRYSVLINGNRQEDGPDERPDLWETKDQINWTRKNE